MSVSTLTLSNILPYFYCMYVYVCMSQMTLVAIDIMVQHIRLQLQTRGTEFSSASRVAMQTVTESDCNDLPSTIYVMTMTNTIR
jgi:hypothetical protein